MIKRMMIMLAAVGLIFGGIFGYQVVKAQMIKKFLAESQDPPVTVTVTKAEYRPWQAQLQAVGSLRAVRGVEVTTEIAGLVQALRFRSGDDVKQGQPLVQLNADADIAQLQSLKAAAGLAETVYDRDRKQLELQAVSLATVEADAADLKAKNAMVVQQEALVEKKTLCAPFSGRLGISSVNPGQYLNPGDRVVTLQCLDSVYADFFLPQQELSRVSPGQKVYVSTDSYQDYRFSGKITAVNPRVDPETRNFQVEALISNPGHRLLPGMYVAVEVASGEAERYLTLPQTAVAFNPYGETVFIVTEERDSKGRPILTAKQTMITTGGTRGDQVAVLTGIREGDIVVTSGQHKLRNGGVVAVNDRIRPSDDPAPRPADE